MSSAELENLVRLGQLKREAPVAAEIRGLLRSGEARLTDAANRALSLESRFDLAYNAAHALALAALRLRGYRSENRFLVFQVLPHTLGLPPATWRVHQLDRSTRGVNALIARSRGSYATFGATPDVYPTDSRE